MLSEPARDVVRTPRAAAEAGLLGPGWELYRVHCTGSYAARVLAARPHPDAAYAPDAHEWVLLEPTPRHAAIGPLQTLLQEEDAPTDVYFADSYQDAPPFASRVRHTRLDGHHAITCSTPGIVPGTLPTTLWDAFRAHREQAPGPGMTPRTEVARAAALLVRIVGDALAGIARPVPVHGKAFAQQVRWDPTAQALFAWMGWSVRPLEDGREALFAPDALPHPPAPSEAAAPSAAVHDSAHSPANESPASHALYARLARTWLELVACCTALGGTPTAPEPGSLSVTASTPLAPFGVQAATPRPTPPADTVLRAAYAYVGAASDASPDAICTTYRANAAAFPHLRQARFLALEVVYAARPAEPLRVLFATEQSQGLYTYADVRQSYADLALAPPPTEVCPWTPHAADDAVVLEAFDRRVHHLLDHGTDDALRTATTALHTLARHHASAALHARTRRSAVADVAQAYRLLQTSEDIDDALVVVAFEVYVAETSTRRELLRAALHAIAEHRASTYLRRYLAGDAAPEDDAPPFALPRGLNNIGNTCYLNSVLQYFFGIAPLRALVCAMGEHVVAHAHEAPTSPTIGGRQVTHPELERSCRFVHLLAALFHEMQTSHAASVTPEKELAYLALVPRAWEEAYTASGDTPETLLHHIGTQQDVSECLDNMLFQIEAALAAHPDRPWAAARAETLHTLFVGRTTQQLRLAHDANTNGSDGSPTRASRPHIKEETFQMIPITLLPETDSLYDALDTFFDDEALLGADGQTVQRTVRLCDAPPLLQLQVQRVQYDRTRHRAVKNQARLALEDTLFLDRYMDLDTAPHDDAAHARHHATQADRRAMARLRTRLAEVWGEQESKSVPAQLTALAHSLPSLPRSDALQKLLTPQHLAQLPHAADALRAEAGAVRQELEATRAQIQARWAPHQHIAYQLAAVFMHRGEASHGHYFLDQRDFAKNEWVLLNDTRVHTIPFADVLRDPTGATSYLVVYVRSDLQNDGLLSNARTSTSAS